MPFLELVTVQTPGWLEDSISPSLLRGGHLHSRTEIRETPSSVVYQPKAQAVGRRISDNASSKARWAASSHGTGFPFVVSPRRWGGCGGRRSHSRELQWPSVNWAKPAEATMNRS
jgi:hypothetical protein